MLWKRPRNWIAASTGYTIVQIPESLSDGTKERLLRLTPQEAVEIISAAIEEVDRGSVQSIDSLVKEKL